MWWINGEERSRGFTLSPFGVVFLNIRHYPLKYFLSSVMLAVWARSRPLWSHWSGICSRILSTGVICRECSEYRKLLYYSYVLRKVGTIFFVLFVQFVCVSGCHVRGHVSMSYWLRYMVCSLLTSCDDEGCTNVIEYVYHLCI